MRADSGHLQSIKVTKKKQLPRPGNAGCTGEGRLSSCRTHLKRVLDWIDGGEEAGELSEDSRPWRAVNHSHNCHPLLLLTGSSVPAPVAQVHPGPDCTSQTASTGLQYGRVIHVKVYEQFGSRSANKSGQIFRQYSIHLQTQSKRV